MSPAAVRTFRLLAAVALAAGLSACGKMGNLDRPGPLFHRGGAPAPGASPNAGATSAQATDAARKTQDPTHPIDTVDPRDISTEPAPPRTLPIPGGPQDPFKSQPPGALPDPYANPR